MVLRIDGGLEHLSVDKRRGSQITIGAISGPSEALPSSEALEIPEARERRGEAPGGKYLSATLLVLSVPGSPGIRTTGMYIIPHHHQGCTVLY